MLWTLCAAGLALAQDAPPPPQSLGPLALEGPNGGELRLRLIGQLQSQLDANADDVVLGARIRCLRVGAEARALDGQFSGTVQLNVAPGATELMDLWGELGLGGQVRLRAGIWKIPYTRTRDQSFMSQVLADWPLATKSFGGERQLGLALHDGRPGNDGFGWALGVFTGQNSRKAFATGIAEAYAQPLTNPSDLATGVTTWSFHPELVARVTAGTAGFDATGPWDHKGGGPEVLGGLSATWDLRPDPLLDFSARAAAEGVLKVRGLGLGTVAYLGFFEGEDGPLSPGLFGLTSELTVKLAPQWGVGLVYSRVDTLAPLQEQARGWADAQIGLAPDAEQPALTESLAKAGAGRSASELGGGVTWFVVGTALQLNLDAAWLHTVTASETSDAARARLQAQWVF